MESALAVGQHLEDGLLIIVVAVALLHHANEKAFHWKAGLEDAASQWLSTYGLLDMDRPPWRWASSWLPSRSASCKACLGRKWAADRSGGGELAELSPLLGGVCNGDVSGLGIVLEPHHDVRHPKRTLTAL